MNNYSVTKYYGHFVQIWFVKAKSEKDAWNRAEKDGSLEYQFVHRDLTDIESKGYVTNLDEKIRKEQPITKDEYGEWLKEAVEKGMIPRENMII